MVNFTVTNLFFPIYMKQCILHFYIPWYDMKYCILHSLIHFQLQEHFLEEWIFLLKNYIGGSMVFYPGLW